MPLYIYTVYFIPTQIVVATGILFKIRLFPDKNKISLAKKYKMSDLVVVSCLNLQPSLLLNDIH